MNEQQIRAINESFSIIMPLGDVAATMFYMRLFEIHPELRGLFQTDMKTQGRKLMATISTAVASARNPKALEPALQQLARRHVGYGVKQSHFDAVASALLWMLAEVLGPKFTKEVESAWVQLYTELVGVMLPLVPKSAAAHRRRAHSPAAHGGPSGMARIVAWFRRRA